MQQVRRARILSILGLVMCFLSSTLAQFTYYPDTPFGFLLAFACAAMAIACVAILHSAPRSKWLVAMNGLLLAANLATFLDLFLRLREGSALITF